MFIPKKFQQDDLEEQIAMMQKYSFASLVTCSEEGLEATQLPMIVAREDGKTVLRAHIAKANPIWQSVQNGSEALVIFNGPNSYISPNHYPTKKEHGKAVPTWNYVAVHVKGKISFIHDSKWLYDIVDSLTTVHEKNSLEPWSIADAPAAYIERMLPAIVGVEIVASSIQGQWKLSQNQPEANQRGVFEGLAATQDANATEMAAMLDERLKQTS